MRRAPSRGFLLTLAILSALAVTAAPAQAVLTPVSSTESWSSTDFTIMGSGFTITCPTADFTERIDATGTTSSGRLTLSGNAAARTTCRTSTGTSVIVSCPGTLTLTSTSSIAGTRAGGTVRFEGNPFCHITIGPGTCSLTASAQGPLLGWDFVQASQVLGIRISNIALTADRAPCRTVNNATMTATFRLDSVNGRAGGRIAIS